MEALVRRRSRSGIALLAFGWTLAGCEPFASGTEVQAPTVVLTRSDPVASFSVVLCLEGPDMGLIRPEAKASGTALAVGTRNPVPGVVPTVRDSSGTLWETDLVTGDPSGRFHFGMDPSGPWSDRSGFRCAPPQTVSFELAADDAAESVEVQWTLQFRTVLTGLFVDMDDVRANVNTIDIRRIRD